PRAPGNRRIPVASHPLRGPLRPAGRPAPPSGIRLALPQAGTGFFGASDLSSSQQPQGIHTMASFLRVADIPADELYLLPISDLRRQIRADRNRPSPFDGRTDRGGRDGFRPVAGSHAGVSAAGVLAAVGATFVTDWQLQDEPCPGSRLPGRREDID